MIAQLTGTILEALPTRLVLEVGGMGFELGISAATFAVLPPVGSSGVTLLTRLVVREDALDLYGFSTREERVLFDRLVAITGVGPKLALSVLSTFSPQELAVVVSTQDVGRMSQVVGVGRRKAQRLLMELEGVFQKDDELRYLVGLTVSGKETPATTSASSSSEADVEAALLSMGFTQQEAQLALDGHEDAGATTLETMLSYALRRLGGGA